MTPSFRFIETNGIAVRAAIAGQGPLIVMVHGFPESWYSWRHQLAPLAAAGFTACAIDVRGYAGSARPHAVEDYAMEHIAADVAGVVEALSPDAPAVLIGHDWGAPIVYSTTIMHPDRVRAVAGLSVPYSGQSPVPLNHAFKALFADQGKFFYMNYFQQEGVAEAALEADIPATIRKMYFGASGEGLGWGTQDKKHGDALLDGMADPDPLPAWLSEADVAYYAEEFAKSGFRGPLNRYRNFERDWAHMNTIENRIIAQPSLFIAGERDLVLQMFGGAEAALARMADNCSDLRAAHLIAGVGHWTQQEAPDQTTGHLIDWLATL